jgi:hypothetical protein
MTLSALRKVRELPPSSPLRTTAYDYRTSMLHAFQGEAWEMSAMVRKYITIAALDPSPADRWSWLILYAPYLRLVASDYSDALRKGVEELKKTDPCRIDWAGLEVLDRKSENSLAWWNLYGRTGTVGPARAWLSAARTALSLELTQKVLTIRTVEKERGAWPAELPNLQSEVCPGSRWTYSAPGDGRVSLTLETSPALGPPLAFRAFRPRP